MRLHPLDILLSLAVRIKLAFDRRERDLSAFDPDRVSSIIITSSTAVGDTLMSTPAIRALRERYPRARITAHFYAPNMELFTNNPHVDAVVPFHGGYRKFIRTVLGLRRTRPDLGVILHGNDPQAVPLLYLAGTRFIVQNFRHPTKKYRYLLSHPADMGPLPQHSIEQRTRTAAALGAGEGDHRMDLVVEGEAVDEARAFLKECGFEGDYRFICFQIGAKDDYKVWPRERFVELGRRLAALAPDVRIVITGSPAEAKATEAVAREIGQAAVSSAGRLSLRGLAGLLTLMTGLVTNDTGPMHMAVALETPTVSLFCPTNPAGVGPIQDPDIHTVIARERPCRPCLTKRCPRPFCMEQIEVDEVFEAARGWL